MFYLRAQCLPQHGVGTSIIQTIMASACHRHLGQKNERFALAYPEGHWGEDPHLGKTCLVFSESKEALESLTDFIQDSPKIEEYFKLHRVRPCPGKSEKYTAFIRFRVPGFRNKRPEFLEATRRRREAALEKRVALPYIQTQSLSNRNQFSLFIKREESKENPNPGLDTDSFGLSRPGHPTWLPSL